MRGPRPLVLRDHRSAHIALASLLCWRSVTCHLLCVPEILRIGGPAFAEIGTSQTVPDHGA